MSISCGVFFLNVSSVSKHLLRLFIGKMGREGNIVEAISVASKFLGKRLGSSGDLMNPSKIWMQTVPTQDCDVLFTFPPNTSDHTLMWILSHLRMRLPELEVLVRHHSTTKVHGYYLTTSYENLLKGAEDLRLHKRLKLEYGGGLKEFIFEEKKCFEDVNDPNVFLTSQERQTIVLHLLNSLTAVEGDILNNIKFVEGQPIIPKCLSEGIISQILPLHNEKMIDELRETWVRAFFKPQPLDKICEYYGVKIAIYFAWLGHYTSALVIPAVLGFILWLFFLGRNQVIDNILFVLFAFLNVIWATLYLVSWKRYGAELAYHWGTFDSENELLTQPRPLFKGDLERSPVTGRLEPTYPAWKRNLFRYCVSIPIISLCLSIVVATMFFMLELQEWWDKMIETLHYPFWFSYFPKILMAVVINVFDIIYQKVAFWLNDQENYRLEETYENHLIAKLILFQFVNSFLSLFYIAFYLQDMDKLREQLAALLITRQVIGNIRESCIPFVMEQVNLARMAYEKFGAINLHLDERVGNDINKSPSEAEVEVNSNHSSDTESSKHTDQSASENEIPNRNMSQAEVESSMYKYDGTFEDYLEMFIQFGYVILFSSAFPLAAMCALLNNIVEIRSDAFKLCCIFQRPFGQRVENIGSWQGAMEAMCVIAVMVNSALIGMSGQVHHLFPDLSTTGTIILIVILEHLTLLLKIAIQLAVPPIPGWVATEMAKIEFNRREAAKKLIRTHSGSSLVLRSSPPLFPQMGSNCRSIGCQTSDLFEDELISSELPQRLWPRKQKNLSKFKFYDCIKRSQKKFSFRQYTPVESKDDNNGEVSSSLETSCSSDINISDAKENSSAETDKENYSNGQNVQASNGKHEPSEIPVSCDIITTDEMVSSEDKKTSPLHSTSFTKLARFSPPSFKFKTFKKFSSENQTSPEVIAPKKNFSGLQFLRKSVMQNLPSSSSTEESPKSN